MFDGLGMGFLKNGCVDQDSKLEKANGCLHYKTTIEWEHNLNKEYEMAAINCEHKRHLRIPLKPKCNLINLNKRMKCGQVNLRIETGRYQGLTIEQRVCEVCDSNDVEDEMHFLIFYNAFTQERTELYANVSQFVGTFNQLSLGDKFIVLMSVPNICTFTSIACHNMLVKRQAILYK